MKQKMADFLNVFFGLRKFLLMMILCVVGILFRIKGLLSGGEFVDLLKSTTIAFCATNGVEHLMSTVKEYINSKGQVVSEVATPAPKGDDLVSEDDSEADKAQSGS